MTSTAVAFAAIDGYDLAPDASDGLKAAIGARGDAQLSELARCELL